MKFDHDLLIEIATEASAILTREIIETADERALRIVLNKYNLIHLLPEKEETFSYPDGNVLIFGESNVKEHVIYQIFKNYGIKKERVKLYLGYNELKNFNFKKLNYVIENRLVFFGPIPHSTKYKRDYSSVINMMENEEGYPKIVRLTANKSLKITKSSLKNAIEEEIKLGYLQTD